MLPAVLARTWWSFDCLGNNCK